MGSALPTDYGDEKLRVAVFSDIHADVQSSDTYVMAEPPNSLENEQPLADLLSFIESRPLQADVVLCPGDLGNRSNDTGKAYGWKILNKISERLGASLLVASPGNHDLQTHERVPDPAALLKNLSPSYPSRDESRDLAFWDAGLQIVEGEIFRIVNLNSCASFPEHPGVFEGQSEQKQYFSALDRGAFSAQQQAKLEHFLSTASPKSVNILMCHHHPVEHERRQLFKDTYGAMSRGSELIEVLEAAAHCGRWMIVHGHKHIPLLSGFGNSANSPIVFCAASVGGKLWHPIVTVTRNQFHVINFEISPSLGLSKFRGTIESYMWGYGAGWVPAQPLSGLPAYCGFGVLHDHRDLVDQVVAYMSERALEFERWGTLIAAIPSLKYQTPTDFKLFEAALASAGMVLETRQGMIASVARELSS